MPLFVQWPALLFIGMATVFAVTLIIVALLDSRKV